MENEQLPDRNRVGRIDRPLIVALSVALGANYLSGAGHAIAGWIAGPETPPPYALIRIHGTSAVAVQVLLGALVVAHILPAWRARRHIASGLGLAAALAVLVLSGLGLYYSGDESLRALSRWSHIIIGLALPLPLAIHIAQRRR